MIICNIHLTMRQIIKHIRLRPKLMTNTTHILRCIKLQDSKLFFKSIVFWVTHSLLLLVNDHLKIVIISLFINTTMLICVSSLDDYWHRYHWFVFFVCPNIIKFCRRVQMHVMLVKRQLAWVLRLPNLTWLWSRRAMIWCSFLKTCISRWKLTW